MTTKSEVCVGICKGKCCRFFVLPIRKPDLPKEVKDMEEWMKVRGMKIVKQNQKNWRVKFEFPCPNLITADEIAFCSIYDLRPEVCRHFDGRLTSYDGLDCEWGKVKTED